uniref:Kringle domain-containing protein n=2 Tax=Emiliania huxleyi TaxID=2903 RepID=A0A7S3TMJ6_EMIHU
MKWLVLATATAAATAAAATDPRRLQWEDNCVYNCPNEWIDDGACDLECNVEACNWDGRDCFHDASECFEQSNGADYRGKVDHTKSGRTCQAWAEQMPWHHTMTVFDYPDAGLGGHNYCRNPTGRETGPWCYTTDYPDVEWEECDVGEPKKCDASEPSLIASAQTRAAQYAKLDGRTYAKCEGTYKRSDDLIQGKPIWDRIDPDSSRFIFFCSGKWRVTGSQWREGLLAENGGSCGSFISSDDGAAEWYAANWDGAGAVAAAVAAPSDGLIPLKLREGADGHVKELEVVYYVASLPPSMQGVKVVLLPIQGDADLLLSFSEPRPTRSSATWLDESVGVKQFTLPASSEFFCGRKPSEDFEQGWQQRATLAAAAAVAEECKLHIGVSGFEEGDFKLFLYNYTQDAANAVAGGDMMDYDDFVATSCSPGCDDLRLGNAECDIACNTTECVWDGGDCGYDGGYGFEDNCATACPVAWIGDGYCDEACYNSACQWDGTDCTADSGCADGCMPNWIDDDECDEQCNNEACGWDGHDCSHEADECYTDSRGIDYRGHVAVSAAGHQCQVWSHQTPNAHTKTVLAFPTFGLGGHNFCRNPGSAEIGPWCYTIGGARWELCSVPPPSDKCESSANSVMDYRNQCPVDCANILGNGRCDLRCNITSCAYDAGDCGVGLSLATILEAANEAGVAIPRKGYSLVMVGAGVCSGVAVGLVILRLVLYRKRKEELKLRGYTVEEMKQVEM